MITFSYNLYRKIDLVNAKRRGRSERRGSDVGALYLGKGHLVSFICSMKTHKGDVCLRFLFSFLHFMQHPINQPTEIRLTDVARGFRLLVRVPLEMKFVHVYTHTDHKSWPFRRLMNRNFS